MLKIDGTTIHLTRGDEGTIAVTASSELGPHTFEVGDRVSFVVVEKNKYTEGPVLRKTVVVDNETEEVNIELTAEDTKIGNMINKKKTYWYNIVLNDSRTMVGSDEQGEKELILYPEGGEE